MGGGGFERAMQLRLASLTRQLPAPLPYNPTVPIVEQQKPNLVICVIFNLLPIQLQLIGSQLHDVQRED